MLQRKRFQMSDLNQLAHVNNVTMNNFLWTPEENIDKLGRNLHAQLNNCFGKNKNRFMLSLASVLVEYNVFQEVLFHFLPVGHTHEDVDQMFSRVSTALYKTCAYIIPDHWLPEYRDGDEDSYGLTCLQSVPGVNDILDFVEPCHEKVDVNKLIKDLPEGYGSRLPDSASEYWKAFFRKIREYEQVPDRHESWLLQRLAETVMHPSNEIDEEVPRIIMAIKEKITVPCPPVVIGKQRQRARNIQQMDDYSSLKPGVMVAVFCPTYEQVP
ncbi:uncharacterized protein [Ptychodera flava]|uniref:uncharacterized protein n=1 Tax=Ptychodera flava TaxID=63121 RepID=UPI003969C700